MKHSQNLQLPLVINVTTSKVIHTLNIKRVPMRFMGTIGIVGRPLMRIRMTTQITFQSFLLLKLPHMTLTSTPSFSVTFVIRPLRFILGNEAGE